MRIFDELGSIFQDQGLPISIHNMGNQDSRRFVWPWWQWWVESLFVVRQELGAEFSDGIEIDCGHCQYQARTIGSFELQANAGCVICCWN
jgi:hypothetical protein